MYCKHNISCQCVLRRRSPSALAVSPSVPVEQLPPCCFRRSKCVLMWLNFTWWRPPLCLHGQVELQPQRRHILALRPAPPMHPHEPPRVTPPPGMRNSHSSNCQQLRGKDTSVPAGVSRTSPWARLAPASRASVVSLLTLLFAFVHQMRQKYTSARICALQVEVNKANTTGAHWLNLIWCGEQLINETIRVTDLCYYWGHEWWSCS